MNTEPTASPASESHDSSPEWRPLNSLQRRVLGVLIEKSKTTKDTYPLTLNAITSGCNQKSNRKPQMSLAADDVELTLDELRAMNAIVEIQGYGRVAKYKHLMYQWLGVNKLELAVMGELLLRGEQTLGDLRARASRMDPIAGLSELKPIVKSLVEKKLVVELSPEGRGQMVTHGLFLPHELEQIRTQSAIPDAPSSPTTTAAAPPPVSSPASTTNAAAGQSTAASTLQIEVDELRLEVADLKKRLAALEDRAG